MKMKVECGDVKTAFLQGEKTEEARQIFVEPTKELRDRLGIGEDMLLQLLGAVYGLRTAPKAWYKKVRKFWRHWVGAATSLISACLLCMMMLLDG